MSLFDKERASAIDAFFGNGKEEVFGIHVLVDQVHPALLICQAFALTTLNET
jgi:hypothetical protein